MTIRLLQGLLALVLVLGLLLPGCAPAESLIEIRALTLAEDLQNRYPTMRFDRETLNEFMAAYNSAPTVYIDHIVATGYAASGGSQDLLGHLNYNPAERDQGECSNCWAWAGTGVMEIALSVQEGVYDRLSLQYINSCQTGVIGKACCECGSLKNVADFYDPSGGTGMCVPWANYSAHWQSGDGSCGPSCGSISIYPNYSIGSCTAVTIPTHGVGQSAAIANIKSVLHHDRAVWFAFLMPTGDDWRDFGNFWDYQAETALWDPDPYCGKTSDPVVQGHAVLCVGYNDDDPDPDNHYWVMLNSWGTASGGRPNGLFRMKMDIDYDCRNYDPDYYYSLLWQTLDVEFDPLDSGIEGVVTDHDTGDPLEAIRLFVPETGSERFTNKSGYYRFNLEPGEYTVTAGTFGYYSDTATGVEVTAGAFTEQNFALEEMPTGSIEGTVTAKTGKPIEGVTITVLGTHLGDVTDVSGNYSVEAPIGTYDVHAWHPDYYEDVVEDVEVVEDEPVVLDFALQASGWRWLYPASWRPAPHSAIGLVDPGVWYGAMRVDLCDDMGNQITAVAYHDSANTRGRYAQVHVAEHVGDFESGAPGPWLASTELYYPRERGWVELALTAPVLIEEPGIYWIVVELEDPGAGVFPFGVVAPVVEFANLITWEDPHDPDDWYTLPDFGLDYSWLLELHVVVNYDLTIDSTAGGEVTTPGEDGFTYTEGEVVDLVAVADEGYEFLGWAGDIDQIDDVTSHETTITMWGDYSITAAFVEYTLTIDSTEGGSVTVPDEGKFTYLGGTAVLLEAVADEHYEFAEWTGDVDEIDDAGALKTAITMWGDYSITAVFELLDYTLTIASTGAGEVTVPGEGQFTYPAGTVVALQAVADEHWRFVQWTGDVGEASDSEAPGTTITMWGDYSITADFERLPTITTSAATDVTTRSATLSMEFTMGDYSPIEVRFSYKKSADADWSHTEWIPKTEDGAYNESITELSSGTLYDFKATLGFGGEEITGDTLQFTTDSGCFIATAAYGTDSAIEINILREFRDTVLLPNALGSGFVSFYYRASPPIANFISQHEFIRTLVRVGLVDRIVTIVNWTHSLWP
ncbi:MAG: InlB B-repeat-containing protein [Dehalococcoidia bacterium]